MMAKKPRPQSGLKRGVRDSNPQFHVETVKDAHHEMVT